jgi:hypothetical protein
LVFAAVALFIGKLETIKQKATTPIERFIDPPLVFSLPSQPSNYHCLVCTTTNYGVNRHSYHARYKNSETDWVAMD